MTVLCLNYVSFALALRPPLVLSLACRQCDCSRWAFEYSLSSIAACENCLLAKPGFYGPLDFLCGNDLSVLINYIGARPTAAA